MKLRPVTTRVTAGYPTDFAWRSRLSRWSRGAVGAAVIALSAVGCGGVETSNRGAQATIASSHPAEVQSEGQEAPQQEEAPANAHHHPGGVASASDAEILDNDSSVDGATSGVVTQVTVRRNLTHCSDGAPIRGGGALPPPIRCFTCAPTVPPAHQVQRFPLYDGEGELCGDQISWAVLEVDADTRARLWMYSYTDPPSVEIRLIAPDGTEAAKLNPTRNCVELDLEAGRWTLAAAPISPEADRHASFMIYATEAR